MGKVPYDQGWNCVSSKNVVMQALEFKLENKTQFLK